MKKTTVQKSPSLLNYLIAGKSSPTRTRVDQLVFDVNLEKADWMNIDQYALRTISSLLLSFDETTDDLPLDVIRGGFVPSDSKNLFVEFDTTSSFLMVPKLHRMGIHLVSLDLIKSSAHLSKQLGGLKRYKFFFRSYAAMWYMDLKGSITTPPVTAILGIDVAGGLQGLEYVHVDKGIQWPFKSQVVGEDHLNWHIFLLFSCFSKINNENDSKERVRSYRFRNDSIQ